MSVVNLSTYISVTVLVPVLYEMKPQYQEPYDDTQTGRRATLVRHPGIKYTQQDSRFSSHSPPLYSSLLQTCTPSFLTLSAPVPLQRRHHSSAACLLAMLILRAENLPGLPVTDALSLSTPFAPSLSLPLANAGEGDARLLILRFLPIEKPLPCVPAAQSSLSTTVPTPLGKGISAVSDVL